ncbi:hypothetical protein [Pseudonocardia endophytica]|uniref:Uncharacterized protein n=1 Tax=Pseudonocardia endophytica TaxID=401976 RepID=A0A4R1I823_PSEEN|nr:hypothetical protein [Pseudonocardia endophytica]TCK26292.1 hypothetical protein EV378_2121 [Pseudonocardia endophytica]
MPTENTWFDADVRPGPDGHGVAYADGVDGRGLDGVLLPGSALAVELGCLCSVLGNAAYRDGAVSAPLHDPRCTLHP